MKTIYTSITPEYIPSWGVTEAIRELIQNCTDYNGAVRRDGDLLVLTNKNTVLGKSVLYLGVSAKRGDESTLGQHGEGLKLAMLVLARTQTSVSINNGGSNWIPSIKKNPDGIAVLAIDIVNTSAKNTSFEIAIKVPQSANIEDLYLPFNHPEINCSKDALIKTLPGKLYAHGLFVCDIPKAKYGYNLNGIKLERDRSIADYGESSQRIRELIEKEAESDEAVALEVAETLYDGVNSVETDAFTWATPTEEIKEACQKVFEEKHPNKVPCEPFEDVISHGVSVGHAFSSNLGRDYVSKDKINHKQVWWDKFNNHLPEEAKAQLVAWLGIQDSGYDESIPF